MWLLFMACAPLNGALGRLPELDPQSGGQASVDDQTVHAYALAIRGLERSEQRAFSVGNAFFNDNWVSAPASTAGRDGLGPLFNARSCSSCHFKDGRAAPVPGQAGFLLRLRLSGEGVPVPDPVYGGQIQDFSIEAETEEAAVHIDVVDKTVTYPDGQTITLHVPSHRLSDLRYGPQSQIVMSPRVARGLWPGPTGRPCRGHLGPSKTKTITIRTEFVESTAWRMVRWALAGRRMCPPHCADHWGFCPRHGNHLHP